MANPIAGAAKGLANARAYSHQSHPGAETALALVLAIAAAEMLLSGQMQAIWKALWGPTVPLGAKSAAASGASSATTSASTAPIGNAAEAGAAAAGG